MDWEMSALWIVRLAAAYLAIGLVFGIVFARWGAARLDPEAEGASWGFRLVVLPGAIALWPLLAARWRAGWSAPRRESNAHRRAAGEKP